MNPASLDLLHPHLMETASIIEYFQHRQLAIPNIEQQSRDELLKIFYNYAMPLHKRSSTRNKTIDNPMDTTEVNSTKLSNQPGNKHKRIIYDTELSTDGKCSDNCKSMDLVTNGCKRIKIGVTNGSTCDNKRGLQDLKVDSTVSHKTKRQKITWP